MEVWGCYQEHNKVAYKILNKSIVRANDVLVAVLLLQHTLTHMVLNCTLISFLQSTHRTQSSLSNLQSRVVYLAIDLEFLL